MLSPKTKKGATLASFFDGKRGKCSCKSPSPSPIKDTQERRSQKSPLVVLRGDF